MTEDEDFTVPVDWVRNLIATAAPDRTNLTRAMSEAGLHWSDLSEDGKLIGQRQEVKFLHALIEQAEDPLHAAEIGLRLSGRTSTIVSYVSHASRNMAEAMQAIARLIPLTRPGARLECCDESGGWQWKMDNRDPWVLESGYYQEFVTSAVLSSFRQATGQTVRPAQVQLRRVSRPRGAQLAQLWDCAVETDSDTHSVTFSAAITALPLITHDAPLLNHLSTYGDLLLSQLPDPAPSLRHQVERTILDHLARGAPSIAAVAEDLGLSTRTLTRRLTEDQMTYRGLVEDLRHRKAKLMLVDPNLTLAEIAFLLGYSEQSSFTNAFRRWTGEAPGAWRTKQRA